MSRTDRSEHEGGFLGKSQQGGKQTRVFGSSGENVTDVQDEAAHYASPVLPAACNRFRCCVVGLMVRQQHGCSQLTGRTPESVGSTEKVKVFWLYCCFVVRLRLDILVLKAQNPPE